MVKKEVYPPVVISLRKVPSLGRINVMLSDCRALVKMVSKTIMGCSRRVLSCICCRVEVSGWLMGLCLKNGCVGMVGLFSAGGRALMLPAAGSVVLLQVSVGRHSRVPEESASVVPADSILSLELLTLGGVIIQTIVVKTFLTIGWAAVPGMGIDTLRQLGWVLWEP